MKTKTLTLIIAAMILVGCGTTPEPRIETVYRPLFPPEPLMYPCYPETPQDASIRLVLDSQYRAIQQCNSQLKAIREWKKAQEELLTRDEQ